MEQAVLAQIAKEGLVYLTYLGIPKRGIVTAEPDGVFAHRSLDHGTLKSFYFHPDGVDLKGQVIIVKPGEYLDMSTVFTFGEGTPVTDHKDRLEQLLQQR